MSDKTGGPAFPSVGIPEDYPPSGMTLRDYFADSALHSLIVSENVESFKSWLACAAEAYRIADAMLIAREKR